MNKVPVISVIMPVYNAEKYLGEAIQSILDQTFRDLEFIIINDGSTDKSLNIINGYARKDDRVVVIDRENRGIVATLNEGIESAKGKYIARMDADDISLPIRLEKQLELMGKENLDICGSHYFLINNNGDINGLNLTPLSHETCFITLGSKVPFAHPSVMIRKDYLLNNDLKYGQSEYKIAEDFDLWMRMYEKGARFGSVNEVLFKYRIIENSLSKRLNKGILKDSKKMRKIFLDKNRSKLISIALKMDVSKFNSIEKENFIRLILNLGIKSYNMRFLKKFKEIDKKIIACSILSNLVN